MDIKNMYGKSILIIALGISLATLVVACKSDKKTAEQPPQPVAPTAANQGDMQAEAEADPLRGTLVTGKVLEILNAGGYSYLNLDKGAEKVWVAVPAMNVKVGDQVSVVYSMLMLNFPSKTLNRTFEKLIFASSPVGEGAGGGAAPAGHPSPNWGGQPGGSAKSGDSSFSAALKSEGVTSSPGQPGTPPVAMGSSKAVVPLSEIKVDKAKGENAFTVAELFAKAGSLNGKKIMVKGKVVKVSPNIMGKNWIHVQDGSGNQADKTHDLVITSSEIPDKGEVVTVKGVLTANKDFGSGYKYAALVEDANFTRK
ncbi:MAG: hypothetical protein A2511_08720 [Deltaproteobacteria bacterium RIFOXYD12_FULL_50_9]|nr:MAG: hypothetical protein A2511_08720 [Deltaproteobacteria bacterium RIFOXYD12_FULL_50_9]